jgi:hypothetical protein
MGTSPVCDCGQLVAATDSRYHLLGATKIHTTEVGPLTQVEHLPKRERARHSATAADAPDFHTHMMCRLSSIRLIHEL